MEYEDIQVAALTYRFEYKKKLHSTSSKIPLNIGLSLKKIASPNLSSWCAVNSCSREWKSTTTSQQNFISGSNFDFDLFFFPLK